jgi:hypothetical protein
VIGAASVAIGEMGRCGAASTTGSECSVRRREAARRLKRSKLQADARANRTSASEINNNAKTTAPARLIDPKFV